MPTVQHSQQPGLTLTANKPHGRQQPHKHNHNRPPPGSDRYHPVHSKASDAGLDQPRSTDQDGGRLRARTVQTWEGRARSQGTRARRGNAAAHTCAAWQIINRDSIHAAFISVHAEATPTRSQAEHTCSPTKKAQHTQETTEPKKTERDDRTREPRRQPPFTRLPAVVIVEVAPGGSVALPTNQAQPNAKPRADGKQPAQLRRRSARCRHAALRRCRYWRSAR